MHFWSYASTTIFQPEHRARRNVHDAVVLDRPGVYLLLVALGLGLHTAVEVVGPPAMITSLVGS